MYVPTAQGYAYGPGAQNTPTPAPPAPSTLMAAISRSGELIDRLVNLSGAVEALAIKIGGPFPADPNGNAPRADNAPAMVHLCENIDTAHRLISQMEGAMKAISRTLEG